MRAQKRGYQKIADLLIHPGATQPDAAVILIVETLPAQ